MFKRISALAAGILLALAAGTLTVSAHANLVRSSIHNGQVFAAGHAPHVLNTWYAENLDGKKSWVNVFEGTADHGLVNEKTHAVVNFKNPKEMTLKLPTLGKGTYYFIWYTHSADDGHYAAGIVYFKVK